MREEHPTRSAAQRRTEARLAGHSWPAAREEQPTRSAAAENAAPEEKKAAEEQAAEKQAAEKKAAEERPTRPAAQRRTEAGHP